MLRWMMPVIVFLFFIFFNNTNPIAFLTTVFYFGNEAVTLLWLQLEKKKRKTNNQAVIFCFHSEFSFSSKVATSEF